MHKIVATLGLSLGLLLGQTAYVSAGTPDAVIELSGGSVAAGVGFSWGSGTLIYHGKRYPLKINGFSLRCRGMAPWRCSKRFSLVPHADGGGSRASKRNSSNAPQRDTPRCAKLAGGKTRPRQ